MTNWIDAVSAEAIPIDDVIGIEVAGRDIALYRVGEKVYATDNICTHGHARLCDGFLDGHEIECPLHQGKFDIRDGSPTCAPITEPLHSYCVKLEHGRVFVQISEPHSHQATGGEPDASR